MADVAKSVIDGLKAASKIGADEEPEEILSLEEAAAREYAAELEAAERQSPNAPKKR